MQGVVSGLTTSTVTWAVQLMGDFAPFIALILGLAVAGYVIDLVRQAFGKG